MRQIVLDTETTGLDPEEGHRIIEIGCIELIDRMITNNHFHFYINPERSIDINAQKVHGITEASLINKPKFADIADQLLEYLKGAELIIHNAPFDLSFLNHEFGLLNNGILEISEYCSVFDTLPFARKLHPGQRNNLDALCKRYSIDNSTRDLHGALLDARLLAQLYLAMTSGQVSLFEEIKEVKSPVQINLESDFQHGNPLIITHVSEMELEEHRKMLAFLQKSSGKEIIW
jgi:DNA polymerase-3 subunit epsilon